MKIMTLIFFIIFLSSLHTFPVVAEIYKYQDEHGKWIFTDKPDSDGKAPDIKARKKETTPETTDLAVELLEEFKPDTAIQQASLAVVSIENPLVNGSGFFISEDGFILTNKHIVKPTETSEWQELQEKFNEANKAYRESDEVLRRERGRLHEMEKSLKEYRKAIDRYKRSYSESIAEVEAEAEYDMYMRRYHEQERDYRRVKKEYLEDKRKYEIIRSEINILSSSSILSKSYKITLKNGKELKARLVSVSDTSDLALLKTDRYKTPYILLGDNEPVRRGIKVFAIGSPLGMKDVITSGIVAGFKDEYVITDAKLLPGSSGGPLLTENGKAIGINSMKISEIIGGEGYGVAIAIDTALSEYGKYLDK
jgi:serine protease Do